MRKLYALFSSVLLLCGIVTAPGFSQNFENPLSKIIKADRAHVGDAVSVEFQFRYRMYDVELQNISTVCDFHGSNPAWTYRALKSGGQFVLPIELSDKHVGENVKIFGTIVGRYKTEDGIFVRVSVDTSWNFFVLPSRSTWGRPDPRIDFDRDSTKIVMGYPNQIRTWRFLFSSGIRLIQMKVGHPEADIYKLFSGDSSAVVKQKFNNLTDYPGVKIYILTNAYEYYFTQSVGGIVPNLPPLLSVEYPPPGLPTVAYSENRIRVTWADEAPVNVLLNITDEEGRVVGGSGKPFQVSGSDFTSLSLEDVPAGMYRLFCRVTDAAGVSIDTTIIYTVHGKTLLRLLPSEYAFSKWQVGVLGSRDGERYNIIGSVNGYPFRPPKGATYAWWNIGVGTGGFSGAAEFGGDTSPYEDWGENQTRDGVHLLVGGWTDRFKRGEEYGSLQFGTGWFLPFIEAGYRTESYDDNQAEAWVPAVGTSLYAKHFGVFEVKYSIFGAELGYTDQKIMRHEVSLRGMIRTTSLVLNGHVTIVKNEGDINSNPYPKFNIDAQLRVSDEWLLTGSYLRGNRQPSSLQLGATYAF